MLEVRIAEGIGEPTGSRLVEKLVNLGVNARGCVGTASREAVARVYWGLNGSDCTKPALNKLARRDDKLQELETFLDHGIPCPRYYLRPPYRSASYPIVGRQLHHSEGRGMQVYNSYEEARSGRRHDYYTKVMDSVREYRIWVFREQLLGCYLREQTWEVREQQQFGRNWQGGWGFTFVDSFRAPEQAVAYAIQAVRACGLDFGGVDVIDNDGQYFVLEVNTCPGADGYCQHALNKLAVNVKEWFVGLGG